MEFLVGNRITLWSSGKRRKDAAPMTADASSSRGLGWPNKHNPRRPMCVWLDVCGSV